MKRAVEGNRGKLCIRKDTEEGPADSTILGLRSPVPIVATAL